MLIFIFNCIFSHHHHTIVRVHESFYLFAQSLHPLPLPALAVSLLSLSESERCWFLDTALAL